MEYMFVDSVSDLNKWKLQWSELSKNSEYFNPLMSYSWVVSFFNSRTDSKKFGVILGVENEILKFVLPLFESQVIKQKKKVNVISTPNDNQTLSVAPLRAKNIDINWRVVKKLVFRSFKSSSILVMPRLDVEAIDKSLEGVSHSDFCELGYGLKVNRPLEDVVAGFKKNFKSNVKKAVNKSAKLNIEYQWQASDFSDVSLNDVLDVEHASWKGEEGTSIKSNDDDVLYFQELSKRFSEDGSLVIHKLLIDEKVVAANWMVLDQGKLLLWKLGYRKEFSKQSPGNLLMMDLIKRGSEGQFDEIDLLTGESWYKNWGMQSREFNNLVMYSPQWFMSFNALYFRGIESIKKMSKNRAAEIET